MSTINFLFSGFGGQGILFSGKFLSYKGLVENSQVSWLPSYGPEMRGGTASCSVILSDEPVGSPIVSHPDVLVAMNLPSLDRFEDSVVPGGKIFVEETLIDRKVKRDDVQVYYIPASRIAEQEGLGNLGNIVMVGHILKALDQWNEESIAAALEKCVPKKREALRELNYKALLAGYNYDA